MNNTPNPFSYMTNFGKIGIVLNEFISLTMVAMKMGIKHYFNYHRNRYKEEKILHQKHKSFTFDLPQIKLN